jgi:hypothetical protein
MTCRLVKIVHPSPVKTYELPAADTRVPEAAWSLLGAKYNVTVLKSDALSGIAHLDLLESLKALGRGHRGLSVSQHVGHGLECQTFFPYT